MSTAYGKRVPTETGPGSPWQVARALAVSGQRGRGGTGGGGKVLLDVTAQAKACGGQSTVQPKNRRTLEMGTDVIRLENVCVYHADSNV